MYQRIYKSGKNKIRHSHDGFSLLELLIYIAILAIVMVILAASFTAINKGRGKSEAQIEVNSNIRFVLERIGQDIRSASSISVPASGATSTSLTTTVSGTQIAYCLISGILRRQIGGTCSASSEAISSQNVSITNLVFTRLENANTITGKTAISVEVAVGMSYAGTSPDWQYSGSKKTTFMMY
ncbi:MAG: hypothetical protein LiPW41_801 [Parcubacteria group bacterium LiPW_41]|nr:MAG: hypothetical protein LiPW41_801 [Parcubacteria group bacterium LiPW_41]